MPSKKFRSVDEYFVSVPEEVITLLEELRSIIRKAAPEAEEVISYNMPAYRQNGMLFYFMAHRNHIGFYPASKTVIEFFKEDLKGYKTSKGTIQLPLGKALPKRLLQRIVKYRVKENFEKMKLKQGARIKVKNK